MVIWAKRREKLEFIVLIQTKIEVKNLGNPGPRIMKES